MLSKLCQVSYSGLFLYNTTCVVGRNWHLEQDADLVLLHAKRNPCTVDAVVAFHTLDPVNISYSIRVSSGADIRTYLLKTTPPEFLQLISSTTLHGWRQNGTSIWIQLGV